ncbi:hypothetical protein GE061_004765 [Apolygus lucorum]|uniref:Uncharacterized protein n=1 Tax=Apolygus lucorum TaxID=248454 RepID=A0A8S9X2R4_APOLU|nr:hypothetical protein GE061_004765 [Apolygus lucorum]
MQHILKLAERQKRKRMENMRNEISKLKKDSKKKERIIERLKRRESRAKLAQTSSSSSPRSHVTKIMKNETEKQIARRVLFGESVRQSVEKYYSTLEKKKKPLFRECFLNNARFLRKYRLLSNFNFLSSRLFDQKTKDITNSGFARYKLKKITEQVKRDVKEFFEDDENSIMCPGKKDCITKHKVKKQKRYLTGTLLELHSKFCGNPESYKLSYATFCRLKPFWVVPQKVTARDTCACRICENISLMVSGLHRFDIIRFKKASDVLKTICCDDNSLACLERNCSNCQNLVIPYEPFEEGEVCYDEWTTNNVEITKGNAKKTVKHVIKATVKYSAMKSVDLFEEKMKDYMHHQAIKIHQSRVFRDLKARLSENEVVIHCDFSENYAMKYGREIQSVHFGGSRKQFSLHTVVIYFRRSAYEETQHQSFCTLSSNTEHGPAAVWAHLKPLFEYISVNLLKVDTVHFQSDSPATQYRNRTIFYLLSHALQVFIPKLRIATWNYSAPGHGKGAVDGVGGAMKRLLDKAVSCGQDISDFTSFVRILQEKSRNVSLYVISPEEIDGMASNIPKVIPGFKGTMKVYQVVYHRCDIPGSKKVLQMKRLSCCDCLSCDKFTLGTLVQDDIAPAISAEEQGEPSGILPEVIMETEIMEMDGHSESHAATIGEAVTTDEPQPGSSMNGSTPTTNPHALPVVGSYVVARFNEVGSKKKRPEDVEYRYVCYITSVGADDIIGMGLRSFKNSKHGIIHLAKVAVLDSERQAGGHDVSLKQRNKWAALDEKIA